MAAKDDETGRVFYLYEDQAGVSGRSDVSCDGDQPWPHGEAAALVDDAAMVSPQRFVSPVWSRAWGVLPRALSGEIGGSHAPF